MLEFLRRNRLLATAAVFLLLAATLLVRSGVSPLRDDRLGRLLLEALAPAQRVATHASRTVADVWERGRGIVACPRRSGRPACPGAGARPADGAAWRRSSWRTPACASSSTFRQTLTGQLLTAGIIGHDATGLSRTITIDQGTAAGVTRGAAVLAPGGHRRAGLPRESACGRG